MATSDKKEKHTVTQTKSNLAQTKNKASRTKIRLFSQVNINVPLPREIAMILPSFAEQLESDPTLLKQESDTSSAPDGEQNSQLLPDEHESISDISQIKSQDTQPESNKAEIDNKGETSVSISTHSSHHLSTKLHPVIHTISTHSSLSALTSTPSAQPNVSNATPTTTTGQSSQTPPTFVDETIQGKYGTLHVGANGQYTFTLDPKSPAYVLLQKQEPGTDTFTLHLSDGTKVVVQIPVHGTQDNPTISGDLTGSVTEDHNVDSQGFITTGGKIDVVDPDHDESSVHAETINGKFGCLTIDANGHWQYRVNNSLTNIQALTSQKALHESFTIHTKDGTSQVLNMTIGGSDDQASISGGSGTVIEDQKAMLSGALSIHDPDAGQDSFIAHQYQGQFGHLDFHKDGTWHYVLDNSKLEVQQLGGSENHHDVFTIQSVDGTTHTINIEVSGTNDTPTIHSQSHSLSEDGAMLSGQMLGSDIDNHATLKYSIPKSVAGLTFNSDGSYTFDPSHSAYQHLAQGQSETITVPVIVTDEHGASATQNLEIVIIGTNDAAKVSGVDTGDVHENQAGQDMSPDHAQPGMAVLGPNTLTTSGKLSINDPDSGESVFDTNGGTYSYSGQYGHLQLHRDGSWNYTVAAGTHDWHQGSTPTTVGSTIDKLGLGETLTDTITVRTKDGTTHDIVVTIHGDNDAPYVSSEVQLNSGKEDTIQTLTAADLLANAIDVDHNDQGQLSIANLIADHGSIRDNQDGTYTYTPESNYHGKVHFSYDINDAHGGSTPTGASLDLASVNDASVLAAGQDSGSVTEDHLRAGTTDQLWSGWSNLDVTDVDGASEAEIAFIEVNGVKHAVPTDFAMNLTANHGYFSTTHSTDGHNKWSYTADNANPDIQGLKSGQQLQDSMVLITKDGTRIPVTATIQGQDDHVIIDTPNALTAAIGTVVEDIKTTVAGMLQAHDLDKGDHVTFELAGSSSSQAGSYGTFYVDRDGHWHYDLDAAKVDSLRSGDGKAEAFNIVAISSDGSRATQKVEVLVKGTNDAATITGQSTGSVTEDLHVQGDARHTVFTGGVLDAKDPDAGQSGFHQTLNAHAINDPYGGSLSIGKAGGWTYSVPNANLQHLAQGETEHVQYQVQTLGGETHVITIDIVGTNDKPTLTAQTQTVNEDGSLLSGKMQGSDIDHGARLTYSIANSIDGLTFNANGSYNFDPSHSAYQHLAQGQSETISVPVTVTDEHGASVTQNLKIVITGTNDAATITGVDTGDVYESTYADRSPDYQRGNISHLWNDHIHTSGKLDVVDSDAGEAHFDNNAPAYQYFGQYGRLILQPDGNWSYYAEVGDSAVGRKIDALNNGENLTDTITIRSADGTTHDVVITIHGDNDAPFASGEVQLQPGKEDQTQILTQAQLFSNSMDVDSNDAGKLHIGNLHADHGSIRDNQDGTYTFTPEKDYNGQVHFIYDVKDAHGGTITTGANLALAATPDNAQISYANSDQHQLGVTEDRNYIDTHDNLYFDGKLNIVDPDQGEAKFDINLGSQTYQGIGYDTKLGGHILLMRDGRYTYTIRDHQPLVQNLKQGETITDECVVKSEDGTLFTIKVNIHGTNDAPTLTAQHQSVTEDGAILSGQMIGQDVDHDATLTYTINHPIDGLTFNSDGSYTFDPSHSSYQQLKDGQTQTITVPVTVTDEHGASATQHLEIKITGTEDAAQISGTDTGTLTEDRHVQGDAQHTIFTTGVLNIVDADAGEDHFKATHNAHALHDPYGGTLTIGKAGDWAYSVPNGNVQHLGQGETQQVQYEVQSLGGDKHIITLTIHGTNDAPVVSADVQLSVGKEDTTQIITSSDLLSNATDIDNNDIGHLSVTNLAVDHGSILDNGDGTFTLIPEKDYNGPLHFQYQVNDGHSGTAPASASMLVAAVNDRPIVQPITQQLKEDSTNHHVIDLLTGATDKEGDTLSIAQISYSVDGATKTGSLPNGFTLGSDGHSLVIDATHSTFQHLAVGQTQQVVVNYLIDDGHGGQTPQTATFTIEGTDDKAVLTSNVIQMSESEALSSKTSIYHGNLQLTDPDTGDHTQFAFSGRYMGQGYAPGSLTIWPDGSYQFRLESAFNRHADDLVDSLLKGESLEFPYQVRTSDGQRLNIIVKVVGEDDQARIEVGQYSTLDNHAYEDNLSPGGTPNQVWSGGNLHVVDPDHGQAGFVAQNFDTPEGGHFSINVRGGWQYTIDNAKLQHLGAGQSYQKTFSVESIDGSAHQTITVTVHGTNDAPVVTSSVVLTQGREDTPVILNASELLAHASDVDDNAQLTISHLSVDHGQVTDNHDGTYTYTPEKNYNGAVQFNYEVTDEHGASVPTSATLTLAAVNDAATFTGDSGNITEDSNVRHNLHITGSPIIQDALMCNGHLVITDVDGQGEASLDLHGQRSLAQDGTYGHFIVTASGSWVYAVDNNNSHVQDLDRGQTLTDSIEVTSKDGTKHSITVTINGTTDAPTLHSLSDSGVQHSGAIEGNLISGLGTHEGVSGAAIDTDSNAHLVLQDIQIKDPISGYVTVTPGHPHTMNGIGTLAIEANGHYSFTPDPGFTGSVPSMIYRVGDVGGHSVSDSAQNRLTIEITPPAQHTPTVTPQTISSDEDQTHTFTAAEFGYQDADHDALDHITITQLPAHGVLTLYGAAVTTNQQVSKADLDAGHLTFTPLQNQNGVHYADFEFTANDGHQDSASASMIIDVNAVNDAPTVGSSFTSLLEDNQHSFSQADFKYTDVDGDSLHHITITNITHGTLSLNGRAINVGDDVAAADLSSLVYTPALNYHSVGASGLGGIQYTANDGHTDSKEGMYIINIVAAPDPATFTGDSTGQAQEDLHTQVTGTLNVADPDGTQGFIAVQGGVGIVGSKGYGHAHIDGSGHWIYNLYNNHPIVQQLKQGETVTETITVQAKDGTSHDIAITVTGTNDIPTAAEKRPASHTMTEDSHQVSTGQLITHDTDGDTLSLSVDPNHGASFGSIQLDSHTNTWTYQLDNANPQVDALNDGDVLHDTFTLLIDDGHGGQTSQQITMTINGHTDPVPYTPPTISVSVDTHHAHHVTPTITAQTVRDFAQSIGQTAHTMRGNHEISGHDHADIIIVQGRLTEEAELKDGNDILFIGGRLSDEEIEGGHGSDTLILGAYTKQNAPRLHDHGEKLGNMELESIENIILGDGTVLKGHLPANFPVANQDHYEYSVDIHSQLSSSDETVAEIRLTHLENGLSLSDNGQEIHANPDGSYTVPSDGHFTLVSNQPLTGAHPHFATEVTTHNSVTGVTAVTSEDLQGQLHSHITPPPPPPPPAFSQSDEIQAPDVIQDDIALLADDTNPEQHLPAEHLSVEQNPATQDDSQHGVAAYLSALGLESSQANNDQFARNELPDDIDIVLSDEATTFDPLQPDADGHADVAMDSDSLDEKHDDLIAPDEHHDHGDPNNLSDPY
ncbi:VCBS domain-containing protein [Vibrio scophthalmi]|uniref:VBCS repeat-containing protein n=1 Tax=Vibrio scophthalmi LMG 19158 TaxID=870967 RepID=F9RLW7_9VIBR|nr:VCBS domain-containing protein [Vibrio scophthalmi]EGU38667.1 VBCS repeat-containing protein [Vibrio scophthalmi LMG 19158]